MTFHPVDARGVTALRETSSATTRLVLEHVRQHLGDDAVAQVVADADVPYDLEQLTDASEWVSYDARVRLFAAATRATGDPQAMYAVGGSALKAGISPPLVALLRGLGSPRQVFRQMPRAVAKFSTTSTMQLVESGRTHATISFSLHEGYVHSRLDCLYAQGLLSVVPEIFGLPPARIVHEECESDGAAACVYRLSWTRRWGRHRTPALADVELAVLRQQLEALQSLASELVSSDRVEDVLQRITERAASAVLAPGHLLAVRSPHDGARLVVSAGVDGDRVDALAELLLSGGDLGPTAVVVEVASDRHVHGRLAALHGEGQRGLADEHRMLDVYARHAAVALDLLVAVEGSRRGEERATALLGLARTLAAASTPTAVADSVVLALPGIVGSTAASVLLWDAAAGVLRPVALAGVDPEARLLLLSADLHPGESPELVDMLTRREPRALTTGQVSAPVEAMLALGGSHTVLAVPLASGKELLGVATCGWPQAPLDLAERIARLAGVADQASTALSNARLVETMKHQSLHDALTGLPNRVLFNDRLDQTLLRCAGDGSVAVLFCDLDRFKQVNDVLGHAAGDELLRQVAVRLRECLRPGDSVGRLSGDEFAVLLEEAAEDAEAVAQRVVRCFDAAFRVDGRELRITTSVGVAVHHGHGGRGDRLLRAADSAMYVAKQRGRNQISSAHETPTSSTCEPSLEQELAAAADEGQLRLFLQPIVAVDAGQHTVVGAEALMRWEHPRLGLLPPAAFLPLAEESGLVVALDLWAVHEACAQAGRLLRAGRPMPLSVNLAGRTLVDPRLVPAVREAIALHDVDASLLRLEVVESQTLVDLPTVAARLTSLRQLGVLTALDDFGTGYSTLSWLQQLPVDRVKLDRSFIRDLPGAQAVVLVRGVLALAAELGIDVVAEGVETSAQLDALVDAGCRLAQGYLLGRPTAELLGEPALR